jgi:hypothetical protein
MFTRLRGNAPRRSGPYPLGQMPREIIIAVGRQIVHRLAVGGADIVGDDFGKIFASAIGGQHRGKPLGVADVGWESCAWSIKTISAPKPFQLRVARLISGRNSPVYSHGINEPFADLKRTGSAVLNIWNERVNEAYAEYDDLRIVVLVRNITKLEFLLMEFEAHRYNPADYTWELKSERNLVGRDASGVHRFTWQSSGSQFTILHEIPPSARLFRILRQPPVLSESALLQSIGFDESWIETVELDRAEPAQGR